MKILFLLVIGCLPLFAAAQAGTLIIDEDSGVQKVMRLYQTFATEKRAENGYRVQLASGTSRTVVLEMKTKFMMLYPDVNAYVIYQQPQFKLRVGDFENRYAANNFSTEIKSSFPNAFVVPDKIVLEGIPW